MRRFGKWVAVTMFLVLPTMAFAQGPGGGRWGGGPGGPGGPRGPGGPGGPGGCARLLMHAPPEVLKASFGLDDAQIKQLEPLRLAFLNKQIQLRASQQQAMLLLQVAMQADLPDQTKVLDLSRKARGLRGQMEEEKIKTVLKVLQIMNKEQRAKLRLHCPGGLGFGGKGMGRGGHGWGGGPGGGRGPGGPGGPGGGGW